MNDTRFDRLVDGELSEEERKDLLSGLDNEPGGWRRCALAFLEAQCWKQVFGDRAIVAKPSEASTPTVPPSKQLPSKQASPWLGRMGMIAAMAASFLAALWIGTLVRERNGHSGSPDMVASQPPVHAPHISPVSLPPAVPTPRPSGSANEPCRVVNISPQGNGRVVSLPARESKNTDEQLRNTPTSMPPDVLQALNRMGHQVEQRRNLVPVSLKDGRQMVVPVDQVDLHYVGNTY